MIMKEKTIFLKDGTPAFLVSAAEKDGPAVLELWKTAAGESDFLLRRPEEYVHTGFFEGRYLGSLAQSESDLVLLCKVSGEVAGYCQLSRKRYIKNRHRALITVAVAKKYWEKGIGKRLLLEVMEKARDMGIAQLELEVIEGNDRALALYETLGFAVAAKKPDAILQPDGRLVGELYLVKKIGSTV